jgi:hypothetical protein
LYGLGQWNAMPARDLTAARAGSRRRAAEQRDELAPLHVEHGDFLPYALSEPPTSPCSSANTGCSIPRSAPPEHSAAAYTHGKQASTAE